MAKKLKQRETPVAGDLLAPRCRDCGERNCTGHTKAERAALRHRMADPHCTCNDCIAHHAAQTDRARANAIRVMEAHAAHNHDCDVCGGSGNKSPDEHKPAGGSVIEPCPACKGTGETPPTGPVVCPRCGDRIEASVDLDCDVDDVTGVVTRATGGGGVRLYCAADCGWEQGWLDVVSDLDWPQPIDATELVDIPDDEECAPNCASRVPFGECTCGRIDRLAEEASSHGWIDEPKGDA